MRENLFCGKSLSNNEWVEGYYAELGIGDKKDYYIIQNCAVVGIFKNDEDNKYFNDCLVDPKTICQYTGKNDINNVRIFENNIIQEEDYGCIGVVKFGEYEGGYGYYIKWISEKAKHYRQDFWYWQKYDHIQVIGNIFDNQEMLIESRLND